jgi:sulfur carrier protein
MQITVNGETRDVSPGVSLLELIDELGLKAKAVVAQRNGDIVVRTDYAATVLTDGDEIELVRFVGGG